MPSSDPSIHPSSPPSVAPSSTPSFLPSVQPSSSPTAECRDNDNFDPATHTFHSFGPQGITVVLTRPFDPSAFEGATCDALREDEDLRNIIVSCCTEVTNNDGGGRRLQLNNANTTNTTNSTIDVVFDTTIVTIGELACVDADSNSGENCQEVLSGAINSGEFGDMIGGTVVDLQQLSTKSTKSGISGGSTKSSKSGSSGGSMKGSKVSSNGTKISKSGTGGSSF